MVPIYLARVPVDLHDLLEFAKPSSVTREPSGAIVLHHVAYLGENSSNVNPDGSQNRYPLSTRQESEPLYEGAKVFIDHPTVAGRAPSAERGLAEQIGRLRGPFDHQPSRSYADMVLNPKHPQAERVAWDAEHSPDSLGLSHNAQGETKVEGKQNNITRTTKVRSVDIVCSAATTHGLYEGTRETTMDIATLMDALEAADPGQLAVAVAGRKAMGDLFGALQEAATAPEPEPDPEPEPEPEQTPETTETAEAVEAVEAPVEIDTVEALRQRVDELETAQLAAETRAKRDGLLEAARIAPQYRSAVFLEALYRADEPTAAALIEDRKRLVHHQHPVSGTPNHSTETIESASAYCAQRKGLS